MTEPRPWTEAEFAALLARPEIHLAADRNGLVVGRTAAGEAELLMLATLPEARRQGHARRHLALFEAEAASRGAEVAFLEVAADNAPAIALYLASGFAETGRRRGYYRRDGSAAADAIVMRKSLAPDEPHRPAAAAVAGPRAPNPH